MTCASVDYFHLLLRELIDGKRGKKGTAGQVSASAGCRVEKLHGQMDQLARTRSYEKFCKSSPEDGAVLVATDVAARGIDVEAVNWVVQFDPPVDPSAFVHRIGRTARAGRSGRTVLLLLPHEDGYVPFLEQRGVALEELPDNLKLPQAEDTSSDSSAVALRRCKKLVEADRAVMLKASKAFVSFVRAYQEHQLPFIFPFKSLDLGDLATGFCLLRMPRMKEILGRPIHGFKQSEVNPIAVPFRNKEQERVRQETLAKQQLELEQQQKEVEIKKAADVRREEKLAKKAEKERTRTQKRQAKRHDKAEEWRMLAEEECLAKKLRRGRINASQFEARVQKVSKKRLLTGNGDDDDGDSESDDAMDSESDAAEEDATTANAKWAIGRKKRRGAKKRNA